MSQSKHAAVDKIEKTQLTQQVVTKSHDVPAGLLNIIVTVILIITTQYHTTRCTIFSNHSSMLLLGMQKRQTNSRLSAQVQWDKP
jgi:hypothetical protein